MLKNEIFEFGHATVVPLKLDVENTEVTAIRFTRCLSFTNDYSYNANGKIVELT